MGPMAEDFADAFGLGTVDEHIANVDADGVALAAIQGLAGRFEEATTDLRARIEARDERVAELEAEAEELRAENDLQATRLDELETENEQLCERNDALTERLINLEKRVASLESGQVSPATADD